MSSVASTDTPIHTPSEDDWPPKRKANGWDWFFWLIGPWTMGLMRLIGRHARWSAKASNWAGVGATVALIVIIAAVVIASMPTTQSMGAPSTSTTSSESDTAQMVERDLGTRITEDSYEQSGQTITVSNVNCGAARVVNGYDSRRCIADLSDDRTTEHDAFSVTTSNGSLISYELVEGDSL